MPDPSDGPAAPQPSRGGLSLTARWTIALVAVAAAIAAFVILNGDDDSGDSGSAATSAATAPASSTPTGTGQTTTTPASTAPAETAPAEPDAVEATIRIVGGQPEGGLQQITVQRDDEVRLRFLSDTAEEIHLHGYDLTTEVPAGGEGEIEFVATIEGRFEVELHGSGTQVARLDVEP